MAKTSIKRNYVLNTAYQILSLITPLVTAPYISRVLGAEGVGIYSYSASVVAFFTLFAVLGTTVYGQRSIAQCRDDRKSLSKCFWEIELLSVITTSLSVIAWLAIAMTNDVYRVYFLILTFDLLAAAFDIVWFYSGLERFDLIVLRNAAVKIAGVLLMFLLVKRADQVWIYMTILSVGKLAGNLTMWVPLRSFVDFCKPSMDAMRHHLHETIVYFIPTAAASVYTYLDKVMIGAYTVTNVENGYYEQTNKIIGMGNTFLTSINTVMSSRMSYLYARGDAKEMRMRLRRALSFIMTLGVPLSFGVGSVAGNLVGWYFGPGFEKVSILLTLASPLILLMGVHNYLAALILVPTGQRARSTWGVIVGAAINLVLNLLLIPIYQSIGAVVATVAAELSICLIYIHMSKGYIDSKTMITTAIRPLVAGSIMALIIAFTSAGMTSSIMTTLVQIMIGVVSYGTVMILLRDQLTRELIQLVLLNLQRIIHAVTRKRHKP